MSKMGIFEKYGGAGSRHGGAGRITLKIRDFRLCTTSVRSPEPTW